MRILTYNIHRWQGTDRVYSVERLARVIESVGADVVGLNEVVHPVLQHDGQLPPLAELAHRLDMEWVFGPSGWMSKHGSWQGPLGNALLSRYPVRASFNHLLPRVPMTAQRSLLEVELRLATHQPLRLGVTHLDHALEPVRLIQLRGILRRHHARIPHILIGDFNIHSPTGRRTRRLAPPVIRRMHAAGFVDAYAVAGKGRGGTFRSDRPVVRIDYIWVRDGWERGLCSCRVLDNELVRVTSDHRPLLAEWRWSD